MSHPPPSPNTPHRVVIVGGGISGLAAAHRLAELSRETRQACSITLLEAQDRFGGLIDTQIRDGFVLECGPDAFLAEKPWAVRLCERLGLTQELIDTQPAFRRSFIVTRGRLIPIPEGWYLIAPDRPSAVFATPLLSWPGKLRMACEPLIPPRREQTDESVASFIRRRLGQEVLERIGQPMVSGIYTADPETLSVQAAMPRLVEMERRYGSLMRALAADRAEGPGAQRRGGEEVSQSAGIATDRAEGPGAQRRGGEEVSQSDEIATTRRTRAAGMAQTSGPRYSLFVTLRRGLRSLIDALVQAMPEVTLRPRAAVARLSTGTAWTITLTDGHVLEADTLCLALPTDRAATLIRTIDPSLADELGHISYESVATVNVAFRKIEVPHALDGFGFVVPTIEHRRIVGCSFSSVKFPDRAPTEAVLLRAFVGGAMHRDVFELDDSALERVVCEELRDLLGITVAPQLVAIHRFPRAMPQYHVGHLDRIASIEARLAQHPSLFLTGNGLRGIGVPDCIHQAELTAQRIMEQVQSASRHMPAMTT